MPAPVAPLSDLYVIENIGSRKQKINIDRPEKEVVFTVKGPRPLSPNSVDDDFVRAFVETKLQPRIRISSAMFGVINLVLQGYELTDVGSGVWSGIATYGKRQPRQTGDIIWSFDGTGGQAHVNVSKETVKSYARSGIVSPPTITGQLGAGGLLNTLTAYYYKVTSVKNGESPGSNEVVVSTLTTDRRVILTWPAVPQATSYRVYRTLTPGVYTSPCLLGATNSGVLGWIDGGLQTPQAGAPPTGTYTPETAPSHSRAIGVNNDTVEGTDVVVPVFKMTCNYYPSSQLMSEAYMTTLCTMQGTVNREVFCGFQPGEVLYMGTTGQPRGWDDWELTMHFIMAPNRSDLVMGEIENIVKAGHEYLWAQFAESSDGRNKLKFPRYAYVERLYDPDDFAKLGIGTKFPKANPDDEPPPLIMTASPPQVGQYGAY